MHKILFICHGNICRSPMAEYIMKYITKDSNDYYIESRATSFEEIGNDIYPKAKEVLRKHNIPFKKHFAKRVTQDDYNNYDYLIIMDDRNLYNINKIINDEFNKVHKLLDFTKNKKDISDPWYTNRFEECFNEIYNGCVALYNFIENKEK